MLAKFLDDCERFDGTESIYSETTVASEFVERELAFHNQNFNSDLPQASNSNDRLQVVNLQVGNVNIYGENEEKETVDSVPLKTISEIINNVNRSQGDVVESEWKTIRRNNCFFGGLITVMTGIIFIAFVVILTRQYDKPKSLQNTSKLPSFMFMDGRSDLGRIGSKRLKIPVSKVIIFDSIVESGNPFDTLEGTFYPLSEDVKENFLMLTDGKILTGRGFTRESEIKFGIDGIYDNEAISINILCDESQVEFTNNQLSSLENFLNEAVEEKMLEAKFYYIVRTKSRKIEFLKNIAQDFNEVIPKNLTISFNNSFEELYNLNSCMKPNISITNDKPHFIIYGDSTVQLRSLDCLDDDFVEHLKIEIGAPTDENLAISFKSLIDYLIILGKINKRIDATQFKI